jgi:hypothetical protein
VNLKEELGSGSLELHLHHENTWTSKGGMSAPSKALGSQLSQLLEILHLPECESACGTESAEDDGIESFAY